MCENPFPNQSRRERGTADFFVTLCRKHFQERAAEPQISPLRCASVEMTKGRVVLPSTVVAEQEQFFIALGGPKPMIPLSKNIPKKEHPHRDLSTALPRISCREPWR